MENQMLSWVNKLFLWPSSIAMLNYPRVVLVVINHLVVWMMVAAPGMILQSYLFCWFNYNFYHFSGRGWNAGAFNKNLAPRNPTSISCVDHFLEHPMDGPNMGFVPNWYCIYFSTTHGAQSLLSLFPQFVKVTSHFFLQTWLEVLFKYSM